MGKRKHARDEDKCAAYCDAAVKTALEQARHAKLARKKVIAPNVCSGWERNYRALLRTKYITEVEPPLRAQAKNERKQEYDRGYQQRAQQRARDSRADAPFEGGQQEDNVDGARSL